jgi:murein DD-endopeptidase MepM/ murein hydrolase activator NlpD
MSLNKKYPRIVIILSLLFLAFYAWSFLIKPDSETGSEIVDIDEPEEEVVVLDTYGIQYEPLLIDTLKIRNRQTLGHIFSGYNFDNQFIDKIVTEMRDVFDPRYIKAGNTYKTYQKQESDSLLSLQYFVYDISPLEYLKIDFSDSLVISRGEKKVTPVKLNVSGIIYSSLWETLSQNNINPELAIKLSEILAWEVDFYRIQRGDRFKVVYEENFVGDESVGIGRIDAIYFVHHDEEIYGFKYEKDTVSGYFGPEGENLRKVFLAAPLKFGRISSGYSASRVHPVLGTRRPHYGTDYAAPTGTPIYAVGDGVVTEARYTSGNGNYVKIRHNSVYDTQYLHMSRFAQGIRRGKKVEQGDVIGYVGMTGLATGPHVCFRFWKNGQQVNHRKEEFPSADPLHPDYFDDFFVIRDQFIKELEAIEFTEEPVV